MFSFSVTPVLVVSVLDLDNKSSSWTAFETRPVAALSVVLELLYKSSLCLLMLRLQKLPVVVHFVIVDIGRDAVHAYEVERVVFRSVVANASTNIMVQSCCFILLLRCRTDVAFWYMWCYG